MKAHVLLARCAGSGEQVPCPEAELKFLSYPLSGIAVSTACPPLGWAVLGTLPCGSSFSSILLQHPLERQAKGFSAEMELDNGSGWRTLCLPEHVMNLKHGRETQQFTSLSHSSMADPVNERV